MVVEPRGIEPLTSAVRLLTLSREHEIDDGAYPLLTHTHRRTAHCLFEPPTPTLAISGFICFCLCFCGFSARTNKVRHQNAFLLRGHSADTLRPLPNGLGSLAHVIRVMVPISAL